MSSLGPPPLLRYCSTVPGTETSRPEFNASQPPVGGFTGSFATFAGGRKSSSLSHFASLSSHSFQPEPERSVTERESARLVNGRTPNEQTARAAKNRKGFMP